MHDNFINKVCFNPPVWLGTGAAEQPNMRGKRSLQGTEDWTLSRAPENRSGGGFYSLTKELIKFWLISTLLTKPAARSTG